MRLNETAVRLLRQFAVHIDFRHTNTRVDPDRYPRTVAYVNRILARPTLAPWIEQETALLAKLAA